MAIKSGGESASPYNMACGNASLFEDEPCRRPNATQQFTVDTGSTLSMFALQDERPALLANKKIRYQDDIPQI